MNAYPNSEQVLNSVILSVVKDPERFGRQLKTEFFNYAGSNASKHASAWRGAGSEGSQVRGAHASRVLRVASCRARFGWLGRDAQADTRDACAPRTLDTDIGWCNASGLAPSIVTSVVLCLGVTVQLKGVCHERRIDQKVETDVPIGLHPVRFKTSPLGTTGSTIRLHRCGLVKNPARFGRHSQTGFFTSFRMTNGDGVHAA
jgi:hypothetical protein